jgi:hypothetical protein
LRRSDSIRNNRSTGLRSRIAAQKLERGREYGWEFARQPGCWERDFWMQRQSAEIRRKRVRTPTETKTPDRVAGNPRRNALFGVISEMCVLRRLNGGDSRAQTDDPPLSHRTGLYHRAGNGNLRCRDGRENTAVSPGRDQSRDAEGVRKPAFWRNKRKKADRSLSPTTAWWAHQGSNLGPAD